MEVVNASLRSAPASWHDCLSMSDDNFIRIDRNRGGGTSEIFNGMFFMYDDWTNDDTPIPEEVWTSQTGFSRSDPSTQIWREGSLEREPGVSPFGIFPKFSLPQTTFQNLRLKFLSRT